MGTNEWGFMGFTNAFLESWIRCFLCRFHDEVGRCGMEIPLNPYWANGYTVNLPTCHEKLRQILQGRDDG